LLEESTQKNTVKSTVQLKRKDLVNIQQYCLVPKAPKITTKKGMHAAEESWKVPDVAENLPKAAS